MADPLSRDLFSSDALKDLQSQALIRPRPWLLYSNSSYLIKDNLLNLYSDLLRDRRLKVMSQDVIITGIGTDTPGAGIGHHLDNILVSRSLSARYSWERQVLFSREIL